MSKKTYTLELTAEELESHYTTASMAPSAIDRKVAVLVKQARLDREADELRLPWRVTKSESSTDTWMLWRPDGAGYSIASRDEKFLKLVSAAPELLEAVKAMERYLGPEDYSGPYTRDVEALIERALRKVETGTPE